MQDVKESRSCFWDLDAYLWEESIFFIEVPYGVPSWRKDHDAFRPSPPLLPPLLCRPPSPTSSSSTVSVTFAAEPPPQLDDLLRYATSPEQAQLGRSG